MTAVRLQGMSGVNPRDFLASLGLLRVLAKEWPQARLTFADDGSFTPEVHGVEHAAVAVSVFHDAASQAGPQPWRLVYEKGGGGKQVADLKPPPAVFRVFLSIVIAEWRMGRREGAAYAAGFATDSVTDGNGNTKPTAFHFTAAQQQFLDTVERIRASIDLAWCEEALFSGNSQRAGNNLRWDPAADRAYALRATDPGKQATAVTAPLEWLAFRSLPLFPVVPKGARAETTGVSGRGDGMKFRWPLWTTPASLSTVASLVRLPLTDGTGDWAASGLSAVCTSDVRRTAQGFGNFGPARMAT